MHRDLKPENIMVDKDDNVKLIDFGIAANAGSRRLTFAKLTQAMGTPDYISPEQVKGKRGDARSDVYSLGIMFYEMLTGKVPFTGPNPFVIMNERLLNNPIPPREIDPDDFAGAAGDHLSRPGARPAKRYPNAHEFALDLEHQEKVGVADRPELTDWQQRRSPSGTASLFYVMLALIPLSSSVSCSSLPARSNRLFADARRSSTRRTGFSLSVRRDILRRQCDRLKPVLRRCILKSFVLPGMRECQFVP